MWAGWRASSPAEPYLVPITYTYRDGFLYGHTLPGQKLEAMRADRDAALAALRGAYPDALRAGGRGGIDFRIRPTAKTGRAVQRSELLRHLSDVEHPLQGIDLRAGDEANFPSAATASRGDRAFP